MKKYFQDYMPGNICFGCGKAHADGLNTQSYWDGDEAVCHWQSKEKYQGWKNLLNGGILASLVDCHCMCTSMAAAYGDENRTLDSQPEYRYATGTLTVKYLQPTPNDADIELRAKVTEIKGRKTILMCDVFANGIKTAEAEVIALRVFDSSKEDNGVFSD
jgi:acyl-coenzyme A thioesterase PaaI-like protein